MGSDITEKVEALEKRLKLLEEERAILSTLYTYGHTIDYGLKPEWVDCFTEDGVWKVQARGFTPPNIALGPLPENALTQPEGGFKGREALTKMINAHSNAPAFWHKHFLSEPVIRLESDSKASVESYFAFLVEDSNGPFIRGYGRYRDKMIKCSDGKWRFQERVAETESVSTKVPFKD